MNPHQLRRYSRQLPLLGLEGQEQLLKAQVLVVGAGGLGCPALQYLVAAGVGFIDIIDGDNIELSNLQRQILYSESDIAQNKARVAVKRLKRLNPDCQLTPYPYFINEDNARERLAHVQLVIDASDNYKTRYVLNNACHPLKIPLISASIYQFDAQLSVFNYQQGPCYQCLYPAAPPDHLIPSCAEGGVLGVLPGIIGSIQAAEALKIITGIGEVLSGKLLTIHLSTQQYRVFDFKKDSACDVKHGLAAPVQSSDSAAVDVSIITPTELAYQLKQKPNDYFLLDVRQPYEQEIISIGGMLIPLAELDWQLEQIPQDKVIIVYCKMGTRSKKAAIRLLQSGYPHVKVLEGGVLQWARDIEKRTIDY